MEYISKNEIETFKIAKKLAKKSDGGDIFALSGDLGSGKTTFAKGFARALALNREITSPTFVIVKTYPIKHKRAKLLVHVDSYRLHNVLDAESIGLPEYLSRCDVITLIEWPERIKDALPEKTKFICFKYLDKDSRRITL